MMEKAFFLDKDGTIVDNSQFPKVIPTDKLMEGEVIGGLKFIQSKGYKVIIISNQSWIARKIFSEKDVEGHFQNIINNLKKHNINILDYFYCPHQPYGNCECRKPKPKMIIDAAKKHNIDLSKSFTVGDMITDIQSGKEAGTKTILVLSGKKEKFLDRAKPDYIVKNVNEISKILEV